MKTVVWAMFLLLLVSCSKSNQVTTSKSQAEQLNTNQSSENWTEFARKNNSNGELTGKASKPLNKPEPLRTVFHTNQHGILQSSKTFNANGHLKWMETYGYDAHTNLQESKRIFANGTIITIRYQYDTNGQEIRRIMIGTNGHEIPPDEQAAYLGRFSDH